MSTQRDGHEEGDRVAAAAAGGAPDPSSTQERPRRDFWDYVDILARPMAGVLTALSIGLIGFWGNAALERDQNTRLYTELMSQREQAESQLRQGMFSTIIKEFIGEPAAMVSSENMEDQLLRLELLALNFSETLSLSPIFVEFDRRLDAFTSPDEPWPLDRDDYRDRLRGLASRVTSWQISSLLQGGTSATFSFLIEDKELVCENTEDCTYEEELSCGGASTRFTAAVSEADFERKTIRVSLDLSQTSQKGDVLGDINRDFTLNLFNFPMIDNTRLANDQRFALVIEEFDREIIAIVAVCFDGMYGSQRDKPILDHIKRQLDRN